MKTNRVFFMFAFLFVVLFSIQIHAEAKYVGVKKCKFCHKKKKTGNQFGIWSKKPHAKAFISLGTAEAKKLALELGITNDPQSEKACLICHTKSKYDANGNERPASVFLSKYNMEEGVQCEDCHGAGENYVKKKTMKKIYKEGGAKVSPTAKATGLLFPDESLCKQCHVPQITIGGIIYKNPTYKGFDYEARAKEIAHPIP